jgi:hypothetical protein
MRRGALIGLVSGLLTGPTMLIWLFVYSFVRPDALSSTAVLGPIMGGVQSTILGVILGAVAGAVIGLFGIRLSGLQRCVPFGVILMSVIGTYEAFGDYSNSPERFAAWVAMIIGMDVACPIVAGMVAEALVAR